MSHTLYGSRKLLFTAISNNQYPADHMSNWLILEALVTAWVSETFDEKLASVGGICVGFWIYSNLLRVKTELKEIFVPPFRIFFAVEFMLVGFVIGLYTTLKDVLEIMQLHNLI